jgi:small subunit ribosomal protein S1
MSEMQESVWPQEELPETAESVAPVAEATDASVEAEAHAEPEAAEATAEPAGPAKATMTEVFADDYAYLQAKRGEIRQAQIISISDDGIMVDLGLKREGLIPGYDLQRVGTETAHELSEGDEISVYVVRPEDREGNIVVSWYRARQEQDWVEAQKLLDSGDIWEGKVKGYNRGGLIVPFGKIRGFVPASHVTGISRRMDHNKLQERLAEMVGQTLPLKVLEVNRQSRRLILSERAARREWRAARREQLLDELQEGDTVRGVVSNICDFGAFVDIGGTDGLVHISELSWRRTNHPREVLSVGDEVEAYVLRVDRDRRRIGLSLKMLQADPWESVEQNYYVGQLVTGVITKLTDFGAFAALEDGIEGLIHISELAEVSPRHPSEVIARDAVVPLLVVKVDGRRRRMGLSLRRVSEEDWYQWEEERRAEAQELAEEQPEDIEQEPAAEVVEEPSDEIPGDAQAEGLEGQAEELAGEVESAPVEDADQPDETSSVEDAEQAEGLVESALEPVPDLASASDEGTLAQDTDTAGAA